MSWDDKANIKDILLFCDNWKTREEIKERFDLSNIESWHCVRFLANLNHEVTVEKRVGSTRRAYRFQTRKFMYDKLLEEKEIKKDVPEPELQPDDSLIPENKEDSGKGIILDNEKSLEKDVVPENIKQESIL